LVSSEAWAQRVSLSEGVAAPMPTLVERDDALSLELNPAGLAAVDGVELGLLYGDYSDDLREGAGALLAWAPFQGFSTGYGLQFIDDARVDGGYRKHTLGGAVGGDFALGWAWNFFGSGQSRELDRHSSWDLGARYTPSRWVGLAFTVRDADSPFFEGASVRPTMTAAGALRLWDGRFLLEAQAATRAGSDFVEPRALAAIELPDGVRLYGHATATLGPDTQDLSQVMVGLELNADHLGFSGAGAFGGTRGGGFGMAARVGTSEARSSLPESAKFYKLALKGELTERTPTDLFGQPSGTSFLGFLRRLEQMRQDPAVQGLVLELEDVSMGYGQLWELRQALLKWKQDGKKLIAYMHSPDQKDYYLATAADQVWISQSAPFDMRGLSITQSFFKGALDKLGVQADFVKIAEYKTSPEAYTNTGPSEANQEAMNAFLDSVWKRLTEAMAEGRGLTPDQMRALVDTAPYSAQQALDKKLVDKVIYPDQIEDTLRETFDGATLSKDYGGPQKDYRWGQQPIIAVLHVDGNIVTGNGGANPLLGDLATGDKAVAKVTEWARSNPRVKALVVRIDSPGGSAIASDRIYRHLRQLAQDKPVIISMGDIAASGGYYTAAGGERIFCDPTTLTGSIGIFSGKFALQELFGKVGYSPVTNKRGARADLYDLYKPWSEEERKVIHDQISGLYELFLQQVSATRNKSRDELHKVARGRIWSGDDALAQGLCDQHGGILDAIAYAQDKTDTDPDDTQLVSLPSGTAEGLFDLDIGVLTQDDAPKLDADPVDPLVRRLLEPWGALLSVGMLYEDGEPLALLPWDPSDL
jgi:protease-4